MCGRFTLHTEKELLQREFEVDLEGIELVPRYNIAPQSEVLVVRTRQGARVPAWMRWGLVPRWAKPLEKLPPMINARRETLATRPAYREPFRHRRCLVLADGFYEWESQERRGPRQPHWIARNDRAPFAMAGIWEAWRPPEAPDDAVYSCSIVTGPANPLIAPIHDRMPVLLDRERASVWLDPKSDDDAERLLTLLDTGDAAAALTRHPVSRDVNSGDMDDAHLIAPIEPAQPSLF